MPQLWQLVLTMYSEVRMYAYIRSMAICRYFYLIILHLVYGVYSS